MNTIQIYTDGACRGNPGTGGWGALIIYNKEEVNLCGGELNTTNNRMELMAAIKALDYLKNKSSVTLTTDSEYVRKGITEWLKNWKLKNWKTASNKPVKNRDLWQLLDESSKKHDINWKWVKGHSGHRENDIADQLANKGIDEL